MSGFEEDLASLIENEFITEQPNKIVRTNSFIDLLSDPIYIPDNTVIDLQIDLLTNEWDLPKLSAKVNEAKNLELDFEDLFNLKFSHKKPEISIKNPQCQYIKRKYDKCVGTLTAEQRRQKILKYLEKRKKRTWQKKIYYDCRKRVADNRLRIKGRFVTKDQAISILGPDHEAIKDLL